MKTEDKEKETMWRYVLDGMGSKERIQFEAELQRHPEKKKEVDALAEISKKLDRLMPLADTSTESLQERIFEEMNQDLFSKEECARSGKRIRFPKLVRWSSWLSLAAGLLVMVGIMQAVSPLKWGSPTILQQAGYRMDGATTTNAVYAVSDFQKMHTILQTETDQAYQQLLKKQSTWFFLRLPKKEWDLHVVFQETQPGKLAISIEACRHGDNTPLYSRTEYYANAAQFMAAKQQLAQQIAQHLVSAQQP